MERVVEHPIDTVFDLIADQTKTTQWCLALTECKLTTDGAIDQGSKRVVSRKFLGVKLDWEFDLDAFERPRVMTWSTKKGKAPMVDTYTLEEAGSGTRIRHFIDTQPTGLLALLGPIAKAKGTEDMAKDLAALEGLLDAA
ncbi:MAG: hypothetical protein HOH89_01005 [Alphaproteobacteria bacterium]|nr:hypothetical protein [Alphaproteobacteria bacterium]